MELVKRLVPEYAAAFQIEQLPQEKDRDVFEIESIDGKVVLRGSSGVAIASAFNQYLKDYCNASISVFWGDQLTLPNPLPPVPQKVRIISPFKYRYCFNYCCFSYSMAWWDWPEWERAIDWMALNGINMPLAVTGQESVWREVGHQLGLSDAELQNFFVGPAYLPFGWMGCMDEWAGPLSTSWIKRHAELEKKILERERALGMTPVLQGFTGHVPAALKQKFPDAAFQQLPSWCGFPGTVFLDPADPLFERVGKLFVEEQTRQFGTNHLYASDTFIEMSPPSNEPAFLERMGKAVYGAMKAGDPEAIWVMQGWLFVNNPNFWKPPQAKALFGAVPDDRLILLDLFCESQPAWKITESFYGKPWVWCIIQSFGNQVSLHAGLPQIAEGLPGAVQSPDCGKLCGAGYIMEGFGQNPVVYELMSELMWNPRTVDLKEWIAGYAARRYGRAEEHATAAWRNLLETAYCTSGQTGAVICGRPSLLASFSWNNAERPYDPKKLVEAWKQLLDAKEALGNTDTYRYDLVHSTRQVLSNYAFTLHGEVAAAYRAKDPAKLTDAANRFLALFDDMDELLATRCEFLLGVWLDHAMRWADDEKERAHYSWNARNQITLWGPQDSILHDYASKQWAGLIKDFYRARWAQFIDRLKASLAENKPLDEKAFNQEISVWENQWTHKLQHYPTNPHGDSIAITQRLFEKYSPGITKE